MKLNISEEQARQIAANAVNASAPMGLGHFAHKEVTYTADDIVPREGGIFLDYFEGRMVKLQIWKTDDGYEMLEGEARPDYQSWAHAYPTYEQLAESVVPGITS